jgi:hypothetical protein
MKKIIFTLLFITAVALAFAQTGLFGLSFGDSFSKATLALEEAGFIPGTMENGSIYFEVEEVEYVNWVQLKFDANIMLTGWTVCYSDEVYDDCEDVVIEALVSWHGEDYDLEYNEYEDEFYVWQLENGKFVEAGWDGYYDDFYVVYY